MLSKLCKYMWAHVLWFTELGNFWLTFFVLAVVLAGPRAFRALTTEGAWLVSGFMLEMAGTIILVLLLFETRADFGMPSFLRAFADRRPTWNPRIVRTGADVNVALDGLSMTGYAGTVSAGIPTIEQRIAALETRVKAAEAQQASDHSLMQRMLSEVSKDLQQEKADRKTRDDEIHSQLKTSMTGASGLEAMALTWIVAGSIATTFASYLP